MKFLLIFVESSNRFCPFTSKSASLHILIVIDKNEVAYCYNSRKRGIFHFDTFETIIAINGKTARKRYF
jgi:hypothetical protein